MVFGKTGDMGFVKLFIDFCYLNLESTPQVDRLGICKNFGFKVITKATNYDRSLYQINNEDWDKIIQYQKNCLEFLEWFYENRYSNIAISYDVPHLFLMAGSDKAKSYVTYDDDDLPIITYSEENDGVDLADDVMLHVVSTKNDFQENKIVPKPSIDFLESISKYPVKCLLRCPKCKNIFLNPKATKRVYCGSRCQALAAVHRNRQKNRDLMEKSFMV